VESDPEVLPPNEHLAAARELAETADGAELFLYPGDQHLFSERSLRDDDEGAVTLTRRVLDFFAGP
jgi:dienelactone hydrolase